MRTCNAAPPRRPGEALCSFSSKCSAVNGSTVSSSKPHEDQLVLTPAAAQPLFWSHTASFLLATGWPWPFTDPTASGGLRLTYPCCWGGTYCVLPLGSGLSSFSLTLGDGGSLSTLCLWVGLSLWPPEDRGLLCSNRKREQRGACSSGEQSDALGQSLAKTTASLCHESWISLAGRLLGTRV